jgi:hypothetical protein
VNSLPIKPLQCPLCQNNWIEAKTRRYLPYIHFLCSSTCGLEFIVCYSNNFVDFNMYKKLTDELEIWWNYNQDAFLWNGKTQKFIYTYKDFVPPFNITLERLTKLMVFL